MENNLPKNDTPVGLCRKKRPRISLPIIVEGRYDKATLCSIFDCRVIVTDGFGIFNSKEKQALIRRIAGRGGVIARTDSDGGGRQIRSFLSGILPKDSIHQLYIPEIEGKERRKKSPSKAGLLGVEGMSAEVLYRVFERFTVTGDDADFENSAAELVITSAELYSLGLTGARNSARRRDLLAEELGLPHGMSAKAMALAIPMVLSAGEWQRVKEKLSLLGE